jgi:hypothetical protein
MNARIYTLPEENPAGKRGRKPKKGQRLISFKEMLKMEDLSWEEAEIAGYDGKKKKIKYLTNTSMSREKHFTKKINYTSLKNYTCCRMSHPN